MARDDVSLLSALREELGIREPVKDGCSPQGQCGCCTVLIDGSPRVACVTAVRRVAGRSVVTAAGLEPAVQARLVDAFARHGASQCGFCTPGILCRLAPLGERPDRAKVESALLAHLCRCTGWRSIVDAACDDRAGEAPGDSGDSDDRGSPTSPSTRRAALEGGVPQRVGPRTVLGAGGFSDDGAPPGCLVAVPDGDGGWAVGETVEEARAASGKVQGRRSGHALTYPVVLPPGDWDLTLQTTWVEPAYLEPDSSWCEPGGEPSSPVANGGAFGGKLRSVAPPAARTLADRHQRPVRVLLSREDVVRLGPKRPPVAAGVRADGTGVLRILACGAEDREELEGAVSAIAPGIQVQFEPANGLPVSPRLRAAGWAEAAVLLAGAEALGQGVIPGEAPGSGAALVRAPNGSTARAEVDVDQAGWPTSVTIEVDCGAPLDDVLLRSYATGAAHMALGWVCSEGIAVDDGGVPTDLTIRSFGILRAGETPPIEVRFDPNATGHPSNGSDAVFAAVAAATWIAQGLPSRWPTRRRRTP